MNTNKRAPKTFLNVPITIKFQHLSSIIEWPDNVLIELIRKELLN